MDCVFNMPLISIAIASVILLMLLNLVLHTLRRAYLTPLRAVPGPWYVKWTHLWLKWKVVSGQRTQYIDHLHHVYGHYVRVAPNEVSISDVSAHRTIHSVGSKFYKSAWYKKFTQSDGPHDSPGIFAMIDPKLHGARRKLFSQPFSNTSITTKEPVIRSKVNMAVDKFICEARKLGHADVMKWWTFLATDVIAELSFGRSFELLEQEKKTQYIRDLETTMMVTGIGTEFESFVKLLRLVPLKSVQDVLDTRSRIDSYGATAIRTHKEYVQKNPESSHSLFARFLDPKKNQSELTDSQLASEAGNLIVAGSDTTSINLTYLTYALLKPSNKKIRSKLLDEISSLPLDAPAKEIMSLPYLKQVIDESLRLYGGGPSLPRDVPSTGAHLGGYFLPRGTTVSTQTFTLMRDPETFFNAERFEPERWNDTTQKMKDAYSPFLIGPRTCLGVHLALFEISCAIFTFLKKCPTAEIANTMKESDMEFENYFMMAPKGHRLDLVLAG